MVGSVSVPFTYYFLSFLPLWTVFLFSSSTYYFSLMLSLFLLFEHLLFSKILFCIAKVYFLASLSSRFILMSPSFASSSPTLSPFLSFPALSLFYFPHIYLSLLPFPHFAPSLVISTTPPRSYM